MKTITRNLTIALLTVFALTSFESKAQAQDKEAQAPDRYFGFRNSWIVQDSKQTMPSELFKGQNDKMLKRLLPEGTAKASINVVLLEAYEYFVLIDAGLGESRGGQLLHKLDSLGVKPEQIGHICLTHFHGDHIGGLVYSNGKAVFPNATLHFSKAECEAWTNGPLKGQNDQVMQMLEAYKGRYQTFDGDNIEILDELWAISAPGHTPGHTMYATTDNLYVGDLMHAVELQLEHPEFSAKYDYDKKLASETRKKVIGEAKSTHRRLIGMHFPEPFYIEF